MKFPITKIFCFLTIVSIIYSSDLQINKVTFPTDEIDENTVVQFVWEVENTRPVSSSPYTTHVVLKDSDENVVFEESKWMASLSGFSKENVVTNTTWTASPGGEFTLTLWIDNENDIDTTNNGFIYVFTVIADEVNCPSGPAINPQPANGSVDVHIFDGAVLDSLGWTNPGDQELVSLYFSEDSAAVASLDSSALYRQSSDLSVVYLINVSTYTKYFWRVVERCEENDIASQLWKFTTGGCASGPATDIAPPNNQQVLYSVYNQFGLTLSWTNPGDQSDVKLYFSDYRNDLLTRNQSALVASGKNLNSYNLPDTLEANKIYHWAVYEFCKENSTEVTIQSFYLVTSEADFCSPEVRRIAPENGSSLNTIPDSNFIYLAVVTSKQLETFVDSVEFFISTDENDVINELPPAKAMFDPENQKVFGDTALLDSLSGLLAGEKYFWKAVFHCKLGEEVSTEIFNFSINPCFAYDPTPPNHTPSISLSNLTKLMWKLSESVEGGISVYLSEEEALVASEDLSVNIFNSQDPVLEAPVPQLKPYTEYFWKVVPECNANLETPVWFFRTSECQLQLPTELESRDWLDSAKTENLYYRGIRLKWDLAEQPEIEKVDIYLHEDFELLRELHPATFFASVSPETELVELPELKPATKYYWALTIDCGGASVSTEIQEFITSDDCESVINPTPNNNSTNVPLDFYSLVWEDPSNIERHEVYFSTDSTELADANLNTGTVGFSFTNFFDIGKDHEILPNTTYYWRVISFCETITPVSPIWNFTTAIGSGVQISDEIPKEYSLSQNYPNPFNPSTNIRFALPEASEVRIEIYNTLGQLVSVPFEGNENAGIFEINFDAKNLASGIYLYRMRAEGVSGKLHVSYKKMLVLK